MAKKIYSPRVARSRVSLRATSQPLGDIPREVFDTIAMVRNDPSLSVTKAAKLSGIDLATVKRHAANALEVRKGRIMVRPRDDLRRKMRFLTDRGIITVTTRDSETASIIAEYWNALRTYIRSGRYESLEPFVLRFVYVDEGTFEFLTYRPTLNRLARAGELFFQDIYASSDGL
jgi:hypothetical protein